MQALAEITGWKVKHQVPAAYISKAELHSYIAQRLKQSVKPEEIRIESLTLKMFGLIPEDFDLEKATVDLVTEQAAAFYDYNRKRLYITESDGSFIEKRIALVHELAHALADQQYSLARFIHKGNQSDDSATAREAVMEGQATWLMWALTQKLGGGAARPSEMVLSTAANETGASSAQFPVFDNAPLYLRESMLFPYNQGLLFQDAVYQAKGKAAFDEVFRNAPSSTAQILHSQLYFNRAMPLNLTPPQVPHPKEYRRLAEGSVGEFDHRILIEQSHSAEEAGKLAAHWRAGAFTLFERKRDREATLTYVSEWDSAEAASQWSDIYKRALEQRNPVDRVTVQLNDRRVTSVVTRAVK